MRTMIMALTGCVGLMVSSGAAAQQLDTSDNGDGSLSILFGSGTALDSNPASLNFTAQGEVDLVDGDLLALGLAIPVTYRTTGNDTYGFSDQALFEVPPSLRLQLLQTAVVRPYADLGMGVAFATKGQPDWLLPDHSNVFGWMTRAALGVEIGSTRGLMVVVEPVSAESYHIGGHYARYSGSIGVGTRF